MNSDIIRRRWDPYRHGYDDDIDDKMERVRYVEDYEERGRRRRMKRNDLVFRTTRNGQPVSRVLSRVTQFQRILGVINIQRIYRGYRARKWYRSVSRPERSTPQRKSFEENTCSHCRLLVSDRYCMDCKGSLCESCFILIHPPRTKHRWHPNGSRVVIVGRSPSPPPRRRRVSPKRNASPKIRKGGYRTHTHQQDSPVQRNHKKQKKKVSQYQRRYHDDDERERRYSHNRREVERRSPSSNNYNEARRYHDGERQSFTSNERKVSPKVSSRNVPKLQPKSIVKHTKRKVLEQQQQQQQHWKSKRGRDDTDADSTSSSECTMATAQSIGRVRDVIKRLRRFRLEREERKRFRLRRRQERRERVERTGPEVSTPPNEKLSPQQQQQEKQATSPQKSIDDDGRRSVVIHCETDPAIARFLRMHGISDRVGSILAQNDIDFELLTGLSDSEMREIGLTLGMRKRLRRALISMSLDRGTSKISASSTIIDPKVQSRMNGTSSSERRQENMQIKHATLKIQSLCRGFIARVKAKAFRFVSFSDVFLKRRQIKRFFGQWKVTTQRLAKYVEFEFKRYSILKRDVEISEPLYSRTPTLVHPGTRLNKNIFETLHKDFEMSWSLLNTEMTMSRISRVVSILLTVTPIRKKSL